MKKIVALFLVALLLMSCLGPVALADIYTISLIAMDSMDEHWGKVRAGAEDAAAELGNVRLTFDTPSTKVDATIVQAQLVQNQIDNQVDAIILAAASKDALAPVVELAKEADIVVILIDSGVSTNSYDAFYATDNAVAARLVADEMAKRIDNQGKVAIVNAQAGAGTTMTRENEFKDHIAVHYPDIEVVDVQYSDGDMTKALNIAIDIMARYPDLAGIYSCNEGSTVGVGRAVEQAGKAGEVKVIGFDFSDDVKELIARGAIQATMAQNPYKMGYLSVMGAVDLLSGRGLELRDVDTGVTVATLDNLAEIQ
ncbi:MAG: ABC transporter substrate-binding protein [Clostridia bacterium]|nr:ABC transporter substrate-binding protein [Clostridia bacterium]